MIFCASQLKLNNSKCGKRTIQNSKCKNKKSRMRKIDLIVIHCSATRAGKNYTAADIDRWHRERGFSMIGYHFVVLRNGTVETGRPLTQPGAHCKGHNSTSIGVCYIGGLSADGTQPQDTRTPEQKTALTNLLTKLKERFPNATIRSHRDFAKKDCPCFDATREYSKVKNEK